MRRHDEIGAAAESIVWAVAIRQARRSLSPDDPEPSISRVGGGNRFQMLRSKLSDGGCKTITSSFNDHIFLENRVIFPISGPPTAIAAHTHPTGTPPCQPQPPKPSPPPTAPATRGTQRVSPLPPDRDKKVVPNNPMQSTNTGLGATHNQGNRLNILCNDQTSQVVVVPSGNLTACSQGVLPLGSFVVVGTPTPPGPRRYLPCDGGSRHDIYQ